MKTKIVQANIVVRPLVILIALLCAGASGLADQNLQPSRHVLLKTYDAMQRNTLRSQQNQKLKIKAIAQADASVVITGSEIEDVPPLNDRQRSPQLGLKVSVELVDPQLIATGQFVDPSQFAWKPGQAFRLLVESATPVQLALFHATPGQQPSPLSPDPDFPSTYKTVMATEPWISPIVALEDHKLPEMLSLIAVRADRGILPINGGAIPVVVNVHSTVDVVVDSANAAADTKLSDSQSHADHETEKLIYSKTKELTHHMLKIIYSKTKDPQIQQAQQILKMHFVAAAEKPSSSVSNDASTLALSEYPVGHLQFVFSKRKN